MSTEMQNQINAELAGLSESEIKDRLVQHLQKLQARKQGYNTPAAKARRKEYYEARKNTPEWKEARKRQAAQRTAKIDALLAKAKELGINVAEFGFGK